MLTFDAEKHEYRWDGVRVPNVTSIIAPLTDYSRIPLDVLERAKSEGRAIHKMIELAVKGILDDEDLPEWLRGRHRAWLRFLAESGFEPIVSEHQMYHPQLGYAGTCDLVGLMRNLKKVKGCAMVDVKRSLYGGPAIGLQTGAYTKVWNDTEPKDMRVTNRFALVLNDNSTYKLPEFDDASDVGVFLGQLAINRWREKHHVRSS